MAMQLVRSRRYLLAALLVLLAAIGARAQAPEFGYWEQTPLPQQGLATFYNSGMMDQVLEYRLAAQDIDPCWDCVGTVALLRAGDIGRKVWLQPPGGDPVGPFQVIDCARRQDVQPLLDRNWVVDVSYEVGQYWGMTRPLDGVIVFEDPADMVPGRQVNRIPTPFAVAPDDVVLSPPTETPAVVLFEGVPTAWPTRLPMPLAGVTVPVEVTPTSTTLPTPTALWPVPLTPIITTPTIAPTESPAYPEGISAQAAPSLVPTSTPTEVAVGRAGGDLLILIGETPAALDEAATTFDSPLAPPTFAPPTARPTLVRTPRPNLTPILPAAATPTPTATPDPGLIDRILRGLQDLVR